VGSEYFINSEELQSKVRTLLPSQGGAGSGFDLSASTQIVPIIDLTESAQGSNIRADLQTAFSHKTITPFAVINATTSIIVNTGYFRVFGFMTGAISTSGATGNFSLSDGSTDKIIMDSRINKFESNVGANPSFSYDFIVFLEAGDSLKAISASTSIALRGCTRQVADITGKLIDP